MDMIRFAIAGASGRMGRMLIETILASPGAKLAGALDIPGSAFLGKDAG
jgi:4-hydroxy-tetrahydrodipicolinate reductase